MKIQLPAPGTWLNVRQITTLTHGKGHTVADMFNVSDVIEARVAAGTMLRQHVPDALGGVTLYSANPRGMQLFLRRLIRRRAGGNI